MGGGRERGGLGRGAFVRRPGGGGGGGGVGMLQTIWFLLYKSRSRTEAVPHLVGLRNARSRSERVTGWTKNPHCMRVRGSLLTRALTCLSIGAPCEMNRVDGILGGPIGTSM